MKLNHIKIQDKYKIQLHIIETKNKFLYKYLYLFINDNF